jgi:hypothetical protein
LVVSKGGYRRYARKPTASLRDFGDGDGEGVGVELGVVESGVEGGEAGEKRLAVGDRALDARCAD